MERIDRILSRMVEALLDSHSEARFLRLLGRFNRLRAAAYGLPALSNTDAMFMLYEDLKRRV